jgi:hypothetical protein
MAPSTVPCGEPRTEPSPAPTMPDYLGRCEWLARQALSAPRLPSNLPGYEEILQCNA